MLNSDSVLVIGLDGATFDLLQPLMDAGMMPNLQHLIRMGVSGPLRSTIPPVTGPAWASFQTGTNPGKHGIVDFMRYRPGSYEPELIDSKAIQGQVLWKILSEHERRICVLNVPVTYPPKPVHGYLVSGFLTPGMDVPFTYPAELCQELLAHVPDYVIAPTVSLDILTLGLQQFVNKLRSTIQQRWKAAEWLIGRDLWDLFMVHFQATDILQHALWNCLDSRHPNFAAYSSVERDLVQQFYRDLDQIIGNLIQLANGATIIIMSDHGFGPVHKRVYVNRWLANHGYLALTTSESWMRVQARVENLVKNMDVLNLRRRLLPRDPRRQRGRLIRRLTRDPWIDWSRTRAFVFSGSTFGNLYINRLGRDLSGTVTESEYERLRTELIECFQTLNDPDTGQPVVAQTYKRETVFAGPMVAELPDLVVRPQGEYLLETRFKGTKLFEPIPRGITGSHRMDGIYVFSGDPFVARPQPHNASILDLAPTILYLLGVPVPDWMDGRVPTEVMHTAYQPSYTQAIPKKRLAPDQIANTPSYSDEEESQVIERLRGLGYL